MLYADRKVRVGVEKGEGKQEVIPLLTVFIYQWSAAALKTRRL